MTVEYVNAFASHGGLVHVVARHRRLTNRHGHPDSNAAAADKKNSSNIYLKAKFCGSNSNFLSKAQF